MKSRTLLFALVAMCFFSALQAVNFAGGSGTSDSPYLIKTAEQLNDIRNIDWTAAATDPPYFRLEEDIDLSTYENWEALNATGCFIHFDGNGHIIRNLTSKSDKYASLFGILLGSCKNLGVINAYIETTGGGAGVIAGYLGKRSPANALQTGAIENCYTTGTVIGSDAVGGIVGNVGKSSNGVNCLISNCYSTCDVMATRTDKKGARAAGIAGILYVGGAIENCYATGTIKASNCFGAAGIVGHAQSDIKACVAMNDSVVNGLEGSIGRIASCMMDVDGLPQGINCWSRETLILDNGGMISDAPNTGEVTESESPYDGETKDTEFLTNMVNYFQDLGWPFAGEGQVWSQTSSNGYPIFQWLYDRGDYTDIDGLGTGAVGGVRNAEKAVAYSLNGRIIVRVPEGINKVSVYDMAGKVVYEIMPVSNETSIDIPAGCYVVRIGTNNGTSIQKVINR